MNSVLPEMRFELRAINEAREIEDEVSQAGWKCKGLWKVLGANEKRMPLCISVKHTFNSEQKTRALYFNSYCIP